MPDLQLLVVAAAVALSAGYACRLARQALRDREGPCADCQLKKNCKKFGYSK